MRRLILASTSPRRKELLALLGVPFDVWAPTFVEQPIPGLVPHEQVATFAMEKARSGAVVWPDNLVLGGDTVIEVDGKLLGKPCDKAEARRMLVRLAGRSHQVHTAVAVCHRARSLECVRVETATVSMKADERQIERYLATDEWRGKAGSYSIQGQGAQLIEHVEGDYTIVVGLPLRAVVDLLRSAGYFINRQVVEEVYRSKPYPNWARFAA
ncbi:MAG: Maf family protein [Nitrospira sp.]|nr:Maf family protein [Nitrospira sp.]